MAAMHFSRVFCSFLAMLLFVECRSICSSEKPSGFHSFKEVNATEKFIEQLTGTVNNAKCRPTHVHIPLESISASYDFFPSVVYVKRCSGHCDSILSCMPEKDGTRIIKVPARLRPRDHTAKQTFVLVDVEEHTACSCMCLKKKEDCTENQKYSKSECRCICETSELEKDECESLGMMWDSDNCNCINRSLKDIPYSTYWE